MPPAVEPRDYRILDYVRDRLVAVVVGGDDYWNDLSGSDKVKIALQALPPVLPGVAIRGPGFSTGYDAPLTDYSRPLTFNIECYAQVTASDEETAIRAVCRLRQDVIKALESDRGLGSGASALVYDLRIESTNEDWIRSEAGAIGAVLRVTTDYNVSAGSV